MDINDRNKPFMIFNIKKQPDINYSTCFLFYCFIYFVGFQRSILSYEARNLKVWSRLFQHSTANIIFAHLFSTTNIIVTQCAMHFKANCEVDCHLNKATYIECNYVEKKTGRKKNILMDNDNLEQSYYWPVKAVFSIVKLPRNLHWKFLWHLESDKLWTMWQII